MHRALAVVLVVSTIGLSACSDRDRQAITVGSPNATPSGEASAPQDAAGRTLTQSEAGAALLTAEDIGRSWSIKTETDAPGVASDAVASDPACQRFIDDFEANDSPGDLGDPVASAEITFAKKGGGLFDVDEVTATVESYAATVDTGVFDEFGSAFEDCRRFTITGEDGVSATVEVFPLSIPNYGDATFALRLQISLGPLIAVADLASVALGHNLVGVGVVGLGGVDTDLLPRLLKRAMARLGEVTASPA